jgi:hypothetical protein
MEDDMRKLVVLMLVLGLATVANAGLWISVNGTVDPPDSSITINPSDWIEIDVYSDGLTQSQQEFYLTIDGVGHVDITSAVNSVNPPGYPDTVIDIGVLFDPDPLDPGKYIFMDLAVLGGPPAPPVPLGTAVDHIFLHCDGGPGDVLITVFGSMDGELDTQIIHNTPEPMTIALLGLGGLFLRRKR